MLYIILSYSLPILGLVIIGCVTMFKNPHQLVNRLFFWLTTVIALWLLALCIGDAAYSPTISLWAVRAATFVGTLIAPLLLYLANVFPSQLHKPTWKLHEFAILPSLLFLGTALTPLLIPSVALIDHSAQPVGLHLIYTAQSVYLALSFVVAFVIMLRKLKYVGNRERTQIKLVITGLVVALIVNVITGLFLTINDNATKFSNLAGALSFLAFVGATSYAIVKYRLFDIRLAITRFIGYVVTVGVTAAVYSLFIIFFSEKLSSTDHVAGRELVVLLIPTIVVALTFHRVERFIARHTQSIFYHDAYDIRDALGKLSDTLLSESDIEKIMQKSLNVLVETLKPLGAYLAVLNTSGVIYEHVSVGREHPADISALLHHLSHEKSPLIDREENPETPLAKILAADDVEILLRLGTQQSPIGVLLLNSKRTGTMYTRQDIALLNISAKNLAIALDNAKKYEQILHFADTLHQEVQRATVRLRHANAKLKTVDALKDDFIATASHQLRTPAASVHDALRMINHPSITPKDRDELLHMAEASSEHLVTVVRTMLNMARLQAGHFTIDRTEAELGELTETIISQVKPIADEKNIRIVFKKSTRPVVTRVDVAKINEAITNYIENAVKYSPDKSTVTVTLNDADGKIDFQVTDQGIGVPASERKHLFGKFYRATNARKEEPDGNGIGLYVVRSIAEGHGGEAYYRPTATDQGSIFGFWFPATVTE